MKEKHVLQKQSLLIISLPSRDWMADLKENPVIFCIIARSFRRFIASNIRVRYPQ